MSSYLSSANEKVSHPLPESMIGMGHSEHSPSHNYPLNHIKQSLSQTEIKTIALLNKVQSDLETSQSQIHILKNKIRELELVATTDILTGLKNRRGFEEHFSRELDKTRRGKSVGGVLVVIDLDSFKAINDTYGHQVGDDCLKLVAATLQKEIRIMDSASRLGGDEFVILMTDTNQDVLLTRVQNIAWQLNHLVLSWNHIEIPISASVGMKPYNKDDTAEKIFAEADHSMYMNKKNHHQKQLG